MRRTRRRGRRASTSRGAGIVEETIKTFRLGYAPNSWEALGNYLKSKGAGIGQIERSGLVVKKEQGGYYDRFRGRLIFPVTDAQGRPVAFGARAMRPGDEPKYLNSPETAAYTKGRHLFGLSVTREEIRRKKFAILVEGYLDLIVPFQHGVRNVVASLGTALTNEQAKLLNRFARKVVVNYDGDRAGINAAKRAIEVLLPEDFEVKVLVLPEGADPDEFVRAHGVDEYNKRRGEAAPHMQFVLEQAMRDRNLHNPPEKSEAVAEVLPFVRAVRNPIQKREYFDIDDGLAPRRRPDASGRSSGRRSARATRRRPTPRRSGRRSCAPRSAPRPSPRSGCWNCSSTTRTCGSYILPQVHESDYEGLATAAIFEALRRDRRRRRRGQLRRARASLLGDDPAQAMLPELWMHESERAEGEAVDVFLAEAEGCLTTLRLMSYERRIKELAAEIAAADRAGDEALHGSLLMKKFELEKQLSALRPRGGPASPSTT